MIWLAVAVAVMPFKDLSGTRGSAGEAIRETVTSDLREVSGVKVIERDRIDQLIAEQNLSAKKTDLDAVATVRLGTLVGATMIVAGAYQRAGATVRLTARLVKVETGEILASAKVDGPESDFLSLQDRLAGELFGKTAVKLPPPRKRKRIKSFRTVELYGDAVAEKDQGKKQKLLKLALDEDPDFVYAVRELEELQKRMGEYARVSSVKLMQQEQAGLARVTDAKRPAAERVRAARELFDAMAAARRYHALEDTAARLAEGPLPDAREEAAFRLFQARDRLHRFDLALQAGERYLSTFPTGGHFRVVETRMHEIAETRRKREARRAEYAADLKEKREGLKPGAEYDYAPCIAARWNSQHNELMLDSCSAFIARHAANPDPDAREHVVAARFFVILALAERGDFARARPLADKLIADSDEWDEELRKLMSEWPTD
jgi:TolB-like protein